MTDTLDQPQHEYECIDCGRTDGQVLMPINGCRHLRIRVRPTLRFADFESYMLSIWDRLEAHTDTSETNREAIDAAIRAVGKERQARCGATFADAADEPVCCDLPAGHDGRHYDRGFTWVPDWRAVGREGTER